MKLERLHLKSFRCFDELTVDFGERLTVIVADSGGGKTALLDAVAIGLGRCTTKLRGLTRSTIKETDFRISEDERYEPYVMLAWEAESHDGQPIAWLIGRRRDVAVTGATIRESMSHAQLTLMQRGLKAINAYVLSLVDADSKQSPYFLPVVVYYVANRATRDELRDRTDFKKTCLRFDALAGALNPISRFRAAFEWFRAKEDDERREQRSRQDFDYRHPVLEMVRNALERILPTGFRNPRTILSPPRFVIDRDMPDHSTQTLRISQLSDGFRAVLALTMDLASRMLQANGNGLPADMEGINPLDLPGIALIDQVDLHLHPAWQRRILTDLMRTFSQTQFIVSTNSPQVLSMVKREDVRIVCRDAEGRSIATSPLAKTYGAPSDDVLQSVMHVDPQPPVTEKEGLQQLTEWVDQGRHLEDQAVDLLKRLTTTLGEQHPQLLRLHRSIRRQETLER
ncbi:AAA family ATPase [Cupriavidus pampae]|uniref:DNA replication and repair protein RecF n=1 Tax=Cupriavidus pampae TaxID=659251 RepID=A0ABM8XG32_9BURK|nr:AAA family ATPase [Cupriavidus pampae]CAG9179003.1 DNA replication and repair protein RecF [Cupriavidus pampae]